MSNQRNRPDITEDSLKAKEHNDCVVVAWAEAFECPYWMAHKYLSQYGRKPRKGTFFEETTLPALNAVTRWDVELIPFTNKTITEFIQKYPVGNYLTFVSGHAFVIRDGVVIDRVNKTNRRRINYVYKITKKE